MAPACPGRSAAAQALACAGALQPGIVTQTAFATVPDCMLALPLSEGGAGGTSRSRKVFTTVLIWRPAGFFAVRNTNGR